MHEGELIDIENYVQTEMLQRLMEKCERRKKKFEDIEKEFFFGSYADCIGDFQIMGGERLQILIIADILRMFSEEKGLTEYANHFQLSKGFKNNKSEVCHLTVGLFYGRKLPKSFQQIATNSEELLSELF